MTETNLKPIRWLRGPLHLRTGSKVTIYGAGDVISDPEHLAALGEKRIQQFIDEKTAAPADRLDLAVNMSVPLTPQERKDAQRVLQDGLTENLDTVSRQQLIKQLVKEDSR